MSKGKSIIHEEAGSSSSRNFEKAKPMNQISNYEQKSYLSFEFEGTMYSLGDTVLVCPEQVEKPHVAIIKNITEDVYGDTIVTGQWFYRPEEAKKKRGGTWEAHDTRELFYSFHFDEFPAESILHHCIVHFIPHHKQLPDILQNPGFIVQRVYDFHKKKLRELYNNHYDEDTRSEIDRLVQSTVENLGDPPDIVAVDSGRRRKRESRRKDGTRIKPTMRSDGGVSYYHDILANYKVLTGNECRDKWLAKLLQGITMVCTSGNDKLEEDKQKAGDDKCCMDVVLATASLERATYETSIDQHKYNQKMRQLDFNLKNNVVLTKRLLDKDLEPEAILVMSPDELKVGMAAEEIYIWEQEDESEKIQMIDASCPQCMEKKVGVLEYIQAGGRGDRYQYEKFKKNILLFKLECAGCGHSWYADRNDIFRQ